MTAAVIMIPEGPRGTRWRDECWAYCQRVGYEIATIVPATQEGWRTAMEMWANGEAQIVVVWRRGHLPDPRLPRVDIISEMPRQRPGRRTVRRIPK